MSTTNQMKRTLRSWQQPRQAGSISSISSAARAASNIVAFPRVDARIAAMALDSEQPAPTIEAPRPQPVQTVQSTTYPVLKAVLYILAFAFGGLSLYFNARFHAGFGGTLDAAVALAVIGGAIDLLVIALPHVIMVMAQERRYALAAVALAALIGYGAITLMSGLGFAAQNIGDAIATRGAASSARADLIAEREPLRAERAGLAFTTTTAEAVAVARARMTAECAATRGGRGAQCRERETDLANAIAQQTLTEKDATLKAAITAKSEAIARAPVIAQADPQAETTSAALAWASGGALGISPHGVAMWRLIVIAAFPLISGLLIACAGALPRKTKEASRA